MRRNIKHILTNALLMVAVCLICLPCHAKREIKQNFNLPVKEAQHSVKLSDTLICPVFKQEEKQNNFLSYHKRALQKHPYKLGFGNNQSVLLQPKSPPSLGIKSSDSIAIYILHEQYLI